MLKETYEARVTPSCSVELQMELSHIAEQERIDRRETSFAGEGKMTQEQFKESMELAKEAASKWL